MNKSFVKDSTLGAVRIDFQSHKDGVWRGLK